MSVNTCVICQDANDYSVDGAKEFGWADPITIKKLIQTVCISHVMRIANKKVCETFQQSKGQILRKINTVKKPNLLRQDLGSVTTQAFYELDPPLLAC